MKKWMLVLILAGTRTVFSQTAQQAPPASGTQAMYQTAAESAARKIQYMRENARRPQPDQTPTVFTEREINAYMASGRVKMPKGVRSAKLIGQPGVVKAAASVDFDTITAGRRSLNPLLSLFSGVHDVDVTAHAVGSGGQGRVHIDSAAIDGVTIPRIALEYFINRYIKPRYPNLGMDSRFALPARVDTATVGQHTLTVTQK
jgi:hypothetical protein